MRADMRLLRSALATNRENDPDTADLYSRIGSRLLMAAVDDYTDVDLAIEYLECSLKIRLVVLGETHPSLARLFSYLGDAYENKLKSLQLQSSIVRPAVPPEYYANIEYYEWYLKLKEAVAGAEKK